MRALITLNFLCLGANFGVYVVTGSVVSLGTLMFSGFLTLLAVAD